MILPLLFGERLSCVRYSAALKYDLIDASSLLLILTDDRLLS